MLEERYDRHTNRTGTGEPLVETGDFTSLPISALNLLATVLSLPSQLIPAISVHKVLPNDKPF